MYEKLFNSQSQHEHFAENLRYFNRKKALEHGIEGGMLSVECSFPGVQTRQQCCNNEEDLADVVEGEMDRIKNCSHSTTAVR